MPISVENRNLLWAQKLFICPGGASSEPRPASSARGDRSKSFIPRTLPPVKARRAIAVDLTGWNS
jgi:hypothetical protein